MPFLNLTPDFQRRNISPIFFSTSGYSPSPTPPFRLDPPSHTDAKMLYFSVAWERHPGSNETRDLGSFPLLSARNTFLLQQPGSNRLTSSSVLMGVEIAPSQKPSLARLQRQGAAVAPWAHLSHTRHVGRGGCESRGLRALFTTDQGLAHSRPLEIMVE